MIAAPAKRVARVDRYGEEKDVH